MKSALRPCPAVHHQPLEIELLEDRLLLSGNVNAFVSGTDLIVIGDNADNNISIVGNQNGIRVRSNGNTTVNGSSSGFIAFASNRRLNNLIIDATGGNNTYVVRGNLRINNSVRFFSHGGRDAFGIRDAQIGNDVEIHTGTGADRIALRDVTIGDDLRVFARSGFNIVSTRRVSIGDDVEMFAESGDDYLVFEDTQVGDDLRLFSGSGADTIALSDSSISDHAEFFTGSGNDFVSVDDTRINDNAHFFLAGGNDAANVSGTSRLVDHARFFGDGGNDSVQTGGGTIGDGQSHYSVENVAISAAAVADALTDPGGAFPKADVAQSILGPDEEGDNGTDPPDSGGDGDTDPPPPVQLTLTTDASSNGGIQSNNTLIVDNPNFEIAGTTTAGATVEVDSDADGQFDDGTATVDADGNYTVSVQLQSDNQGNGSNVISVRSTLGDQTMTESLNAHRAEGTVVRYDTSLGSFDVELFDSLTPLTVQNFLNYQQDGDFDNTIIHRSATASSPAGVDIIQGGGFALDGTNIEEVADRAPVTSEQSLSSNNVAGTIALALSGSPTNVNSGTNQFYFNVDDNLGLNTEFTVFGRIIGDGLELVRAINAQSVFNLAGLLEVTALNTLPLRNYTEFTGALTGTASVSLAGNTVTVTGTGTQFLSELNPRILAGNTLVQRGQRIRIGEQEFQVDQIISDTELTAVEAIATPVENATVEVNVAPTLDNFIRIDSIERVDLTG